MGKTSLIRFLLILSAFAATGQVKKTGVPHIEHYSRHEYQAGTQNWDMLQMPSGVIYFANNSGILEYNGEKWKTYSLPNYSVVRSLARGDSGEIYAGAYNELGMLKEVANGRKKYISLRKKIPEKYRDFGELWRIHNTKYGIIFQSFSSVFLYQKDSMHVLAHNRDFHFSFYLNGTLYISEWEKGLMKFTGDSFRAMPGGEFFREDKKIWTMMQLDKNKLLIGTQDDGLFIYEKGEIVPWETPANDFLVENQLFSAVTLPKGNIAFGSIQNGLIICDKDGNIQQHINKDRGMANNTILSTNIDTWGNLWCGLDNGIDYIEIHSPFTNLDDAHGIRGTGYASSMYQNKLYVGTNQGAFYTPLGRGGEELLAKNRFQEIRKMKGQVWEMKELDSRLFCGHNRGAFIIDNGKTRQLWKEEGCWNFLKAPWKEDLIIAGTYKGLVRFVKENGSWQFDGRIDGFDYSSRDIAFDENNDLWMSHGYSGVYRLTFNQAIDSVVQVTHYTPKRGLHSNFRNYMFRYNKEIMVSRPDSVFRYNALTNRFEYSPEVTQQFGGIGIDRAYYDRYSNFWYFTGRGKRVNVQLSSESPWKTVNFDILNKLNDHFIEAFEHVHVIDGHNILFGVENGFAHVDPLLASKLENNFKTIITQVKALSRKDTLSYNMNITSGVQDTLKREFSPKKNTLKIFYAAAFFEDEAKNFYSYRMDKFNGGKWSEWTSRGMKEYTNLPPGEYLFEVKARNVYGVESPPAAFAFIIETPWYKTVWAYMSYALIAGITILLLLRYVESYIQKEREQLDEQRKKELQEKEDQHRSKSLEFENQIIQLKNDKLQAEIARKKADVELKNKELASFAAQMSHKNEILNNLRQELERVKDSVDDEARIQLNQLSRKVGNDLQPEEDWKKFKMHFDQVQGDFIQKMQEQYPNLTPKDLKLCAFLRMNLATKEIAPLMSISVRGVEIHRYRLRKKLQLERDTNLVEFLMQQ